MIPIKLKFLKFTSSYDCDLINGKTAKSEKKKMKKFFEPDHTCYECGKKGHYAYDCVKRLIRERDGDFKKVFYLFKTIFMKFFVCDKIS